MSRILVVDNYDSFVWNLVHYLAQLGAEVEVWRNDDERFAELLADRPSQPLGFDGILLSPGPGTPEEAGVCVELVRRLGERTPIFGVCLGLQSIAVAYGGTVGRAPELLHGKVSSVFHDDLGTMAGLPNPFDATRYHSLAISELPEALEVTARTESGVIMTVRHRQHPVEAVQFHPESVLTQGGHRMLANWLAACGDPDAVARSAGLRPLMVGG
ncbi:para-aminobenzoate synthetase component 2 [Propionibacteriaceae bacterium ES.041]|uniref:Aminodeoxychorismate/anthranilate synthase component II n=1 Tax=Enemella evansiae TaxID=2016499 RepID=A0A255GEV3_9ACTN|nr:aminodeoxychorismate/anthranilate synthase component II [Enemella evansiae]OYO11079.1 aminodeoxychorismate/anthranilate synthase component II [Enemella evansiae]OYO12853.1 aminodeoxychorismate/anthranilate synthase component II [Enemella evansiae]PFG65450.1 para-aminobenzoate synthetase component 2 [Propionibacteriaceae bacterium ES.041]